MVRALRHRPPTPSPVHAVPQASSPVSPPLPRVMVLTPGPGDIVTVGQPVLIRWQTLCLPGLLLHCIQLSIDGGLTYRRDISPLLDGKENHYLWVPTEDLVTPAARLRIVAINWGQATQDGVFSIRRAGGAGFPPAAVVP